MRQPPRPAPVYAIADAGALDPTPLSVAVRQMVEAGILWVQVRAKRLPGAALYRQLEQCLQAVEGTQARLWIDDRADLAALFPVAGVHLGQRDLPPGAARPLLRDETWIGLSTHNRSQIEAAAADPAVDVVAVGPIFPTGSKERPDPVVGLALVREARRIASKPLVAIGGITAGNIRQVLEAGADGAAVIGAACRGDIGENCRRLLAAAERQR